MPRKTLAKWIMVIGTLEVLLLFPFAFWGGNFGFLISLLLMVPIVAVSFVWWKQPKGAWISSLLITWGILVVSPVFYALYFFEIFKDIYVDIIGYSIFFGTLWFVALMAPVGLVYAATIDLFKRRNVEPATPVDGNRTI